MGCDTGVMRLERTVWTKRSTSIVFVPFHRGDALRERGCKVDFRLSEVEGTTQVQPGIRYSNDGGKTWSAVEAMSSTWTSSAAWVHLDHFHAVNNDYLLFEVGLQVQNSSGTTQGTARAEIIVTMATVLDLEIGRDVQAWSIGLDAVGSISPANNTFIVGNGTTWVPKTGSAARDSLALGTSDQPQFTRLGLGTAPNASYSLTTAGAANFGGAANIAVTSNPALTVSGAEALWYNGTYFRWGEGATWNRFPDKVRIGDATTPTNMLEVQGTAEIAGALNLAVSGAAALTVSGVEALWYNGTYFSWGFGGTWNYFADKIRIGTGTAPTKMFEVDGDGRFGGALTLDSTLAVTGVGTFSSDVQVGGDLRIAEAGTAPVAVAGNGFVWVRNDAPNTLMFRDDDGNDYPAAGMRNEAYIHLLCVATSNLKGIEFNPWDEDNGADISTGVSKNIAYVTTTGRCTVTYAGIYKVDCAMILEKQSGSANCTMRIKVNGATAISRGVVIDTSPRLFTISTIVQLTASQYVEVTVNASANMTMNADSNLTILRIGGTG